ncbi:MAG: AAA family ATPase, partial [Deltaproteobacteria bacterium]|nr:AAA family ATPase [Deltaproteobacteria bacterium]
MRPLRLTMRAFGPYVDEINLDFSALAGRSLFLIHGPTGAGKTSILDAICFALFGETAGSDRPVKKVRSDFADASVVSEVTFDFALGERVFRVHRSADHPRP